MKQIFSVFFLFWIYIYTCNFQYLGRVEGKTVLSCTYLFKGFTSQVPFFYGWVTSPSESAGSAFLLTTVQRFCSMLFTGHYPGAGNARLYSSTSVLKTKVPFPNFLWRKRTIFGAKAFGQSFDLFFFLPLYFIRATTMTYIPFSVQPIITSPSEKEVFTSILNLSAVKNWRTGYFKYSYNKDKVRKINRFSKLIRVTGVENSIYLNTVHLNTKKMPYLLAQRIHILTLQIWRGEITQKNKKKRYSTLLNKQQLKKVQRKHINVCLNNKKKSNFRETQSLI